MTTEYFIKRVYEPYGRDDGCRILVDRLWPRGLSKEQARVDVWLKEIAPSDELRKWFAHDPAKWKKFLEKYMDELDNNPTTRELLNLIKKYKRITLLYSSKEEKLNNAYALLQWLNTE